MIDMNIQNRKLSLSSILQGGHSFSNLTLYVCVELARGAIRKAQSASRSESGTQTISLI